MISLPALRGPSTQTAIFLLFLFISKDNDISLKNLVWNF